MDWIEENIIEHNAFMTAAYVLVVHANELCSTSKSEAIETALLKYHVNPKTGEIEGAGE